MCILIIIQMYICTNHIHEVHTNTSAWNIVIGYGSMYDIQMYMYIHMYTQHVSSLANFAAKCWGSQCPVDHPWHSTPVGRGLGWLRSTGGSHSTPPAPHNGPMHNQPSSSCTFKCDFIEHLCITQCYAHQVSHKGMLLLLSSSYGILKPSITYTTHVTWL